MKILSNKTYKYLINFRDNYDKKIEEHIEKLNNQDYFRQIEQRESYGKQESRMYDEFEERFKDSEKEIEGYKDNIISLKKKINILVKKTK